MPYAEPLMLNAEQLTSFQFYLDAIRYTGFRAIVHIMGSEGFALARAEELIAASGFSRVEFLPNKNSQASLPQYLQKMLGTEIDALVINVWQGFNPNALGTASGCIKAGGVLLLLTPAAKDWPLTADYDYQRMLSHNSPGIIKGRFVQHILDCLQSSSAVWRIDEQVSDIALPQYPLPDKPFVRNLAEQKQAIAAIKRVANGHAKRPLVIQADRGRGKSSALGIAAGQLMLEKTLAIVVTAPHLSSVQTLLQQAALACGAGVESGGTIHCKASTLKFIPVDVLLAAHEPYDVLLIDEAAAIPASLLEALLKRCKRLVFSTTVQGYEGNGRGFAVRFLPMLKQHFPQLRLLELNAPVRYAIDDPLEQFCAAALLLKIVTPQVVDIAGTIFCSVDRDELVKDKARLQQLFALLVTAHYQTSPDDLRLLLDHPEVSIYSAEHNGRVLAVALLMQEGGFNDADCTELTRNNRRFRGHLLPQTLWLNGFDGVLQARFQRVVRIAVLPECQRHGLGKQLLGYIEQQLVEQQSVEQQGVELLVVEKRNPVDFIGASFSAEPEVLQFWQSVGLHAVRLGVHKESASGQFPCVVLKPIQQQAHQLFAGLVQGFTTDLPYQLLSTNHNCSAALAMALLANSNSGNALVDTDIARVKIWLLKQGTFESVQASLYRVLLHYASYGNVLLAANASHQMLVQKLLLNHPWPVVCAAFDLTGRAAAEEQMRTTWQTFAY